MRRPLPRLDDPGDDVERPRPVDAAAVGVHRERDAHREDVGGGGGLPAAQLVDPEGVDDGQDLGRGRPRVAVGVAQLVPRLRRDGSAMRATLRDLIVTPPFRT